MHSTNYFNTFIEVAEDCPVAVAEVPPQKGEAKTIANIQFDMVIDNPYQYTSDDIIFHAYAVKNKIGRSSMAAERDSFFSKGQACLRSSSLGKRYGWGVHSNAEGKIALFAIDSPEYKKLAKDKNLAHVKAMRSKRT
jgi:hypothetical protein